MNFLPSKFPSRKFPEVNSPRKSKILKLRFCYEKLHPGDVLTRGTPLAVKERDGRERKMAALRNMTMVAGLLASSSAFATDWDWTEEFQSRHWRNASLQWAQDIHPQHPSFETLKMYYAPPAHEMWCHGDTTPTQEDLSIHTSKMNEWLRNFLQVPAQDPLPPTPPLPFECVR
jgi:hypothetical protein